MHDYFSKDSLHVLFSLFTVKKQRSMFQNKLFFHFYSQ